MLKISWRPGSNYASDLYPVSQPLKSNSMVNYIQTMIKEEYSIPIGEDQVISLIT